ncbi:MAG: gliding motility-associated C-terminal domain-containing protein [Saprospiraceae bacterium]|nr:gliding motility-associated C-terminal domain-containing protein [Saprospiraceae bacterium]MBK9931986.1 gliding motility-associated C-terminal domain-containing protein [Saprospiraceae bacterium]
MSIQEVNNACFNLYEIVDNINICAGENYQGHSATEIYYDTVTCNSVRKTILTVLPQKAGTVYKSICQGETFEGHGTTGIFIDTLLKKASNGCDSIRTINLSVLSKKARTLNQKICNGTVFAGYTTAGTYVDTLIGMASNGCDSIRTINLTVNPNYQIKETKTICAGSSYDFNGQMISNEGEYLDTIHTLSGCDSLIILDLKIARNDFLGYDTSICIARDFLLKSPSDNTSWFDNTTAKTKIIYKTGTYWATILDANGCEIVDTIYIQFNVKSFVPNVFSPNDDGINDCFFPNFSELSFVSYRLGIFDRWGSLVFHTENPQSCWDGGSSGEKCDAGVYTYFIEIETEFCKKTIIKGDVTLIK